jgi:ankyrin repeat protein
MMARLGAAFGFALLALTAPGPCARADISSALNPFSGYTNNVARAAEANDVAKVRALLSSGNSVNEIEADSQRTGLHTAAINGNLQIVAILIKAGARIDPRDNLGNTPLEYAADHGHLELANLLMDVGAQVDAENKNGMTALMIAAKDGNAEMVRALLARGANPNKSDYTGRDSLGWALDSHRPAVVAILKDAQAHKH